MGLMDSLEGMLGGGQNVQQYQDFVNRYEQGGATQSISHEEALNRYNQIVPQLPPQQYQQAAEQAFSQFSPQERQQFAQYLHQQAQQQNVNLPGFSQFGGSYQQFQNPSMLAQLATGLHQQSPGLLSQLLGGGIGGGMGGGLTRSPLAKMALAGIAGLRLQVHTRPALGDRQASTAMISPAALPVKMRPSTRADRLRRLASAHPLCYIEPVRL